MQTHTFERVKIGDKNLIIYRQKETNDDWLFRKARTASVSADDLEKADIFVIEIPHRGVVIQATKELMKQENHILTFAWRGKTTTKYHLPIEKWELLSGDKDWIAKVDRQYYPPKKEAPKTVLGEAIQQASKDKRIKEISEEIQKLHEAIHKLNKELVELTTPPEKTVF